MRRRLGDNPIPPPETKPIFSKDLEEFKQEVLKEKLELESRTTEPAPPPSTRSDEGSHLSRGFERIVKSIFDDGPEIDEQFAELREKLAFDERASSKSSGQIQDALDRASEYSQQAAELLARAKINLERFEAYASVTESAIRERAHNELTQQKEDGTYKGRFSKDDVESVMTQIAADEYSALNVKRAEVKRTIDVLEALAANWVDRTRNLRAMLAMGRGV